MADLLSFRSSVHRSSLQRAARRLAVAGGAALLALTGACAVATASPGSPPTVAPPSTAPTAAPATSPRPQSPVPAPTGASVVVAWNVIALRTSAAAAFNPPMETRNLAIVQAAVLDAVVAASDHGRPYAVTVTRPRRGSASAAVVGAAHDTLVALYPEQQPALDLALRDHLAGLPTGTDTDRGLAIGRATAAALLALRRNDGSATVITHAPGSRPGEWRPTPPGLRPALEPGWGQVAPFLLERPAQFRPGPPPALTSRRYARDFAEIKAVGALESAARTSEQAKTAQFWVATAPQLWNQVVQQLVVHQRLSVADSARAFAVLNLAGADAFIAAWDAKFNYQQWRPITGIREADTDGNPTTAPDPTWTPLLGTPPFPDYPAAHAVYAGAAETVLTRLVGRRTGPFVITSASASGLRHTYADVQAVAAEVVDARVWGGVHWRTSCTVGRVLGQRVGGVALHRQLG